MGRREAGGRRGGEGRIVTRHYGIIQMHFPLLTDIQTDPAVSKVMAEYNVDVSAEEFGPQHFTYNNSKFADFMFRHYDQMDFRGIVVSV